MVRPLRPTDPCASIAEAYAHDIFCKGLLELKIEGEGANAHAYSA
jgi:hypothetical protein